MKKFSVIIASYNGEKTIKSTIDSILNQTGIGADFAIELIVVDDCSTDTTPDILLQSGVKMLSTPHHTGGPNKGRNIGLEMATGDYICIVDQDDIWHTDRIMTILPHVDEAPVLTTGFTIRDTRINQIRTRIKFSQKGFIKYPQNATFLSKLKRDNIGQNTYLGSIVFSADLKNILFEEKYGAVDYDWLLRLLEGRESIEICESLYTRNLDGNNLSLNHEYRMNAYRYSLDFIKRYEERYPEHVSMSRKRINGSQGRYYYVKGDMNKARIYFINAEKNIKNILYYLTTYFGSDFVRKNFPVFG